MFPHISPDSSALEEIIRKNWPSISPDSTLKNESEWDILNDNNKNDASGRHWFKQNFINQMPQTNSKVMYH